MTSEHDKYITLMASMPALPTPFAVRQLPISRLGLEARLRLLDEADAQLLAQVEAVMVWERIDVSQPEPAIIAELEALMGKLPDGDLRDVVRNRFELRTVLAAMRRRRHAEAPPARGAPWGYGRYVDHIRRNWSRPHFGLRGAMPWLAEMRDLHDAGETLALDRAVTLVAWKDLADASPAHEFDFDAVALYVLRYDMVARWLGRSPEAAGERFDGLVATGLGDPAVLLGEAA